MATIGFGSLQQSQEADAQARERTADLARDQAALASAQREVQVLAAKLAQAQALLDRSQAVERRAALDLGYTTIVAPIDGVVAARAVPMKTNDTPTPATRRKAATQRAATAQDVCGRGRMAKAVMSDLRPRPARCVCPWVSRWRPTGAGRRSPAASAGRGR